MTTEILQINPSLDRTIQNNFRILQKRLLDISTNTTGIATNVATFADYLPLAGGTMTGNILMGTNGIGNDAAIITFASGATGLTTLAGGLTIAGNFLIGAYGIGNDNPILTFASGAAGAVTSAGNIYLGAKGLGNNAAVLTFASGATGLATFTGAVTLGGNLVIPNAGNIGSVSDTDAITIASGGEVTLSQTLILSDVVNAGVDPDKFLCIDASNNVDYRTGAEVLSDIGASASVHTHDGDTLQLDGVNSDGGAFAFTTTGDITFIKDIILDNGAGISPVFKVVNSNDDFAEIGIDINSNMVFQLTGDTGDKFHFNLKDRGAGTGADNDVTSILIKMETETDNTMGEIAEFRFTMLDATAGTEDGQIGIYTAKDGTLTLQGTIDNNGVWDFQDGNLTTTGTITGRILTDGTFSVTGGAITGATNTNWDAAYAHISNNGSDHSYIDQDVTSGAAPTFTADNFSDGGLNAIVTTTQETNWDNHLSSDGSSHTFINQSVVSGSSPTFDGTNFTGIPSAAVTDNVSADAGIFDHTIVRGHGGAKVVQDSGIVIDDSDNVSSMGTLSCGAITSSGNLDIGAHTFTVNSIEIVGSDGEVNKAAVEDSGNWDTAYTHSQDNTQAHSDYLLNNADDYTTHHLTIGKAVAPTGVLDIINTDSAYAQPDIYFWAPLTVAATVYNSTKISTYFTTNNYQASVFRIQLPSGSDTWYDGLFMKTHDEGTNNFYNRISLNNTSPQATAHFSGYTTAELWVETSGNSVCGFGPDDGASACRFISSYTGGGSSYDMHFTFAIPTETTKMVLLTTGELTVNDTAGTVGRFLDVNGLALFRDKICFTQTDYNEYIDSDTDGYLDFHATTAIRAHTDLHVNECDLYVIGAEGGDAEIFFHADQGDDNADKWRIKAKQAATQLLTLDSYSTGSWVELVRLGGGGKLAVGADPLTNECDVGLLKDGVLAMKETTTPTADTNYGKIYCKIDNKVYFQDGAGSEHDLTSGAMSWPYEGADVVVQGAEGNDGIIGIYADQGDDNADKYRFRVDADDGQVLYIESYQSGAWVQVSGYEPVNRTINLNSGMSATTIIAEIAKVGKCIPRGVTIIFQFADGTYTLDTSLEFAGFYGGGDLRIYGNAANNDSTTTKAVDLDFSGSSVHGIVIRNNAVYTTIRYLDIETAAGYIPLNITDCNYGSAINNYCHGGDNTSSKAIQASYSNYVIQECQVAGASIGISCENGLIFSKDNIDNAGDMPEYGLYAGQAGRIGKHDATQPDGSVSDENTAGGGEIA